MFTQGFILTGHCLRQPSEGHGDVSTVQTEFKHAKAKLFTSEELEIPSQKN